MKKLFFLFVLIQLSFIACRKPIDANSELIGNWYAPVDYGYDMRAINIDENGNGVFGVGVNAYSLTPDKKVKANEHSFRIGYSKFEILVHPIDFDSATDWVGAVAQNYAPGYLPVKKMEIKQGGDKRWYYRR